MTGFGLSGKKYDIVICCITSCSVTRNFAENDVPLLDHKRDYLHVQLVWFLDPVNTKDFFERFQPFRTIRQNMTLFMIVLEPELFLKV